MDRAATLKQSVFSQRSHMQRQFCFCQRILVDRLSRCTGLELMPRQPRELKPNYCYHITTRCNNREFKLSSHECREVFLYAIKKAQDKFKSVGNLRLSTLSISSIKITMFSLTSASSMSSRNLRNRVTNEFN